MMTGQSHLISHCVTASPQGEVIGGTTHRSFPTGTGQTATIGRGQIISAPTVTGRKVVQTIVTGQMAAIGRRNDT